MPCLPPSSLQIFLGLGPGSPPTHLGNIVAPPTTPATLTTTAASSLPGVTAKGSSPDKSTTKGKGKGLRKRKTTEPTTPRAANWVTGELKGILLAAPTHWGDYRVSRTGDRSRRTSEELKAAFVSATPAENRPVARTRTAETLDRKLKDTRTKYVATRKNLCRTGLSASQREDIVIKFGGSEVYSYARGVFKTSAVAIESTGREPVVLGAPVAPAVGAVASPVGGGARQVLVVPVSTSPTAGTASPGSVGNDMGTELSGADAGADVSLGASDEEDGVPNAVELLAAAEAQRDPKKTNQVSTSGAITAYLETKTERESVVVAEQHGSGTAGSGPAANVVSDNDIRAAVLDMIGAIADKARRQ